MVGGSVTGMPRVVRPIGHEDRLSIVDHLEELRHRLLICAAALAVAFGICMWQNNAILKVLNTPLLEQTNPKAERGEGTTGQALAAQRAAAAAASATAGSLEALARPSSGLPASTRARLAAEVLKLRAQAKRIPVTPPQTQPVTLGVGEPFTTTVTVALWAALVIALPVILWEVYGFILPGLTPRENQAVRPLLMAVPVLFVLGVLFGYFVVLAAAVHFLVNFNSGQFNVLVQANQLYGFEATMLLALGLVFQLPVVIIALARLGILTPQMLRRSRRYALVGCAVIAAVLPGEAITMLLIMVPLYLLYEASILLAAIVYRSRSAAAERPGGEPAPAGGAPLATSGADQSVQQIIDHVDRSLSD
jgi:sec-independent protein translocase protein TatC